MTIASVPTTRGKFLENVQSLRAIATLLIVCSHWRIIDIKYSGDPLSLFNFMGFGRFAIDMFFVVSGFIMVYITRSDKADSRARFKRSLGFLFARFTRVYPIYWIISGALLIVYMLRPLWVFSAAGDPDFLTSFFLWPDTGLPFLNVAWTLVHEVAFYLVFAVLLLLPQKHRLWGVAAWSVLITVGLLLGWRDYGPVFDIVFSPFCYNFIGGILLAYLYLTKPAFIQQAWILWGLFIGSFIAALIIYYVCQPFVFNSVNRVLIYMLPALLCVYSACELNRQGIVLPKWTQTVGNWSFVLYLSHILSLSVIGRVWNKFAVPETPLDNIVMFFVAISGAVIVSAIIYTVLELPLRRYTTAWRKRFFAQS